MWVEVGLQMCHKFNPLCPLGRLTLTYFNPTSVCFSPPRTSLARPSVVLQGPGWRRRAEERSQAGRPREGVPEQTLQSQTARQMVPRVGGSGPALTALVFFGAQGEAQYSSHSSSNTLSSNASSNHSDERWFDAAERGGPADSADPDPDPLNKGGSNDSGIDSSTPYNNARHGNTPGKGAHGFAGYGGLQELSVGRSSGGGDARRRESSPIVPAAANQNKGYRTRTFPPPGSSADKMDAFKPR